MELTLHTLASIVISTGMLLGSLEIWSLTLWNLTVYKNLMIFFCSSSLSSKKKKNKKQMECFLTSSMQHQNKKVDSLFYEFCKSPWMVYSVNKCVYCVCATTLCPLMNVVSACLLEFYFHEVINHCFALVWIIDMTGWGIYYCSHNSLVLSENFVWTRILVGLFISFLSVDDWISNSYILSYSYTFPFFTCY